MMSSTWGVVVASGKSEKFGADFDTAFLNLVNRPALTYALEKYEQCPDIEGVVVVAPKERLDSLRGMVHVFGYNKVKKFVAGTPQRQTSLLAGLAALDGEVGFVSVHDGSRPCVTVADIAETLKSARRYGSGVLAVKLTDPIRVTRKGSNLAQPVAGEGPWAIHTPQAFKLELLRKGLAAAQKKKLQLEDDSEALALIGEEIRLVPAVGTRIRISAAADLNYAELLLRR